MVESKVSEHLVDLVSSNSKRKKGLPNYALFLGSGASWYSGVKTADEMVGMWRNRMYVRSKKKKKYTDWLAGTDWYDKDWEYSYLFEYLYDTPSQRRDCIEEMLDGAHPSWGYVYLASMLQAQIFNAVITTNFDDLVNEACYLYTDGVRPILFAHDSEVVNLRLTMSRPKIIKLHGDFLFDSILKNTESETKRLTENMEVKLAQLSQEYGLVVVGYGGRDDSVMDILERLVSDKQCFKHGIYWCLLSGTKPRDRVAKLLKNNRVYAVDIGGFDELMAMIHDETVPNLPATVINPMKVAEQRSRIFCSVPSALIENAIIRKDIERVLDGLGKVKKKRGGKPVPPDEMPRKLKAAIMKRKGYLEDACEYMKLEVAENKDDVQCAFDYAEILARLNRIDVLEEFIPNSAIDEENKTFFLLFTGDDAAVVKKATSVLKNIPGSWLARINRAIAYKRLGKTEKMKKDLDAIDEMLNVKERNRSVGFYMTGLAAGAAALRKNKKKMLKMVNIALDRGNLNVENLKLYPVFEDYRNDIDFKAIISGRKK